MKDRNNKKFMWIAIGGVVVFLFVIIMAVISSHGANKQARGAQSERGNNQMPFSGLTANIANNLNHQINSIEENLTQGQKALWQALNRKKQQLLEKQKEQEKQKEALKALNQQGADNTHTDAAADSKLSALQQQISDLTEALKTKQAAFSQQIDALKDEVAHKYQIGKGDASQNQQNEHQDIVWVTDMTNQTALAGNGRNSANNGNNADPLHGSSLGNGLQLFDTTPLHSRQGNNLDVNGDPNNDSNANPPKPVAIPAFTIPNPTVLTRAIALTPLIGRIPKGDNHLVWAPFQVLFMVEHPNVTSNGHRLAPQMGKMLGTATCVGDLLAGANACHVDVLTYVFPDGTIANAKVDDQAKEAKSGADTSSMDFKGLGYITDAYGNPQIIGDRKTALGLRIAMTGGTAMVSAYGGGLSQASTIQSNSGMGGIIQQVTNANKYAFGQGINGLAQGVNKEWDDASKNMFDYIYTNNWNADTHRLKRFNIVITQQLDFDYIKHGRKLSYDNQYTGTEGARNAHDLILG